MDQATQEALTGYVRDLFAPEDDALREILDQSDTHGLPRSTSGPMKGRCSSS